MTREETIKKAQELLESGTLSAEAKAAIIKDFPELSESEDERIRKAIIFYLEQTAHGGVDEIPKSKMLAWLEKQKEQNLTELPKSEDYGIDGLYAAIDILQRTLGEVDGYQTDDGILEHKCAISAVKELYEQKPSTPEDIAAAYQMGLAEGRKEQKSAELTSMDDAIEACMLRYLQSAASRKDDDEIMEDTRKYKQELVGLVQKPAGWSEEDEKMLERIIERGSCLIPSGEDALLPAHIEWLKSIHSHWKPSEEQMKHLHNVMIGWHPDTADCQALHSLYEDLKKL